MPRYNIEYKGKWACFSTISDSFITMFMGKDDYEEWRKAEYGSSFEPVERCNVEMIGYAIWHIRLNRSRDEAMKCVLESGLSKDECEQLMDDMEREYYCPKLQEDGTYLCPNCGAVVTKGQSICRDEDCEQELIWKE